jgi:hypothetical protein
MFLHIFYGKHDKKNKVFNMDTISLAIHEPVRQKKEVYPQFKMIDDDKNLSFRMDITDIGNITNDDKGKISFYFDGLDRKNRKVSVYTDNNSKRYVSGDDTDLFTHVDMSDAFGEYKEI